MPKKSTKKGGAFAYVDQFDYPLSPCYKPEGKPPITKAGWHAGGSCIDNKTVAQMGVVDKPACTDPSASETAWLNRYNKMWGGENNGNGNGNGMINNANVNGKNNKQPQVSFLSEQMNVSEMQNNSVVNKLKEKINANKNANAVFFLNANKNGENFKISVFYTPQGEKKFKLTIEPTKKANNNNNARNQLNAMINESFNYNTVNGVVNRIKNFNLKNVTKRNNMNSSNTKPSNNANGSNQLTNNTRRTNQPANNANGSNQSSKNANRQANNKGSTMLNELLEQ